MTSSDENEPFPAFGGSSDPEPSPYASSGTQEAERRKSRERVDSRGSSIAERVRRLSRDFEQSSPPGGFMAATGTLAADIISLSEQQRKYVRENERRNSIDPTSNANGKALQGTGSDHKPTTEDGRSHPGGGVAPAGSEEATIAPSADAIEVSNFTRELGETEDFDNGYHFPPSYPALEATKHGLISFWHYFLTPLGFFVVIYGLNVVAWGGMLFLLLCNASPAMCNGDCNYINSPRRIWIEYDSQILNALFCVTGFGLIPWRFRDLYYLLQYRIWHNEEGLRRLAGIHRGWFRLPGSQDLPIDIGPGNVGSPQWSGVPSSSVPYPESSIPDPPRTGTRAPPTRMWKLDFVIWAMVWNTFLQACLSGFMWGMNRYNRPPWSTGLFVALACIVAAMGGVMMFIEGKRVKGLEGVPVTERDLERLARDKQLGIPHYNNIKDKKPKTRADDLEGIPDQPGPGQLHLKVAGKNQNEKR